MHRRIGGVTAAPYLIGLADLSLSLYKITCSKHQTCPYGCDMVDSQGVRRLLVQEIQEAKKLLKLLADFLQNVQIPSKEEFTKEFKIVVSNDQYYVSIKPKEDEEDEEDDSSNT
jgi:hypothetical protein